MEAFYLLLILLLSLLLTKLVFSPNPKPKTSLPPSPPSLPMLGHLHLIKSTLHHSLTSLSAQLGPVFHLRLGLRPVVVVSSVELAEECFTTNDVALGNRPQFPSAKEVTNNFSTVIFANYGPLWRNLRKIATVQVLSSRRLLSSTVARHEESKYLARRLFVGSGDNKSTFKKINVKEIVFEFVLNVIMGMLAGKRYYSEEAKDWEEARQFRKLIEDVATLASGSNLEDFFPFLKPFFRFRSINRKLMRLVKQREEFSQKLVDEHKTERKKTMIGDLLALQEREPDVYTDALIKSLTLSLLQAGTDTSSNTLEWAMSLLLNNPESLQKAQHEINTIVGTNRLIQESDIPNLPYLTAIINETFRLHPVVPVDVPHESAEECFVGGYRIPKGTMLLVNIHAIHRNPDSWEEPTKFMPERFLESSKEGGQIITFGMGRRKCPGEGLALRMIGLALGTLIQCFEWKTIDGKEVDLAEGSGLSMRKAVHLEAMYRPRPEMVALLMGI
ncbi:hypothetical protein LUZ60_004936 [Juncus effusus]|nr:hypothetical protein LUZ60_004936 [Juncus effusus]